MLDSFNDCLGSLPFPGVDKTSDTRLLWPHICLYCGYFCHFKLRLFFNTKKLFSSRLAFLTLNLTKLGQSWTFWHIHKNRGITATAVT